MEPTDLLVLVDECRPERLPALIAQLEGAKALAWSRLAAPRDQAAGAERLVTMREAAERLGISESQAREMGRRGELPVLRVGERFVRVDSRILEEWIRRGTLSHSRGGQ